MVNYFRTPEMQEGGPFHCFNCKKKLAVKLKGNMLVQFYCPRCHAFITIKLNEPVPWAGKVEEPVSRAGKIEEQEIKVGGTG